MMHDIRQLFSDLGQVILGGGIVWSLMIHWHHQYKIVDAINRAKDEQWRSDLESWQKKDGPPFPPETVVLR